MHYSEWKKEVKKVYQRIERELVLEKIDVDIVEEHELGIHIRQSAKKMVIPYEQIKRITEENKNRYSKLDITVAFIYHELGHYFQYKKNKDKYEKKKRERIGMLLYGKQKILPASNRIDSILTYKELELNFEEEAWNIGEKLYKGNIELYEEMKRQSLKTYEDYSDCLVEEIKKERRL